jgi:hypothetical protein
MKSTLLFSLFSQIGLWANRCRGFEKNDHRSDAQGVVRNRLRAAPVRRWRSALFVFEISNARF